MRVLAATNKDLKDEIKEKRFREDLYHRLSVILIEVPPLKERKEDIPALVDKFLGDISADYGDAKKQIDKKALVYLQSLDWTGNIRELRNVVERLVIMSDEKITEQVAKNFVK